jgi:hypothetical protein
VAPLLPVQAARPTGTALHCPVHVLLYLLDEVTDVQCDFGFNKCYFIHGQVRALNKSDMHYNEYNNSILSWECLTNRQRMFRCLEKDYVALKCFLLERFLHDLLFESPTPMLLVDFLGLN